MKQVFEMIPPGSGVNWFFGALSLLFAGILILFIFMAWSAHHVRFEVADGSLVVRGDLWGRKIPTNLLRLNEAQILDSGSHPQYALRRKTMGTNMPGYSSGWFKLADGQKALVYLSNRHRTVYIPTTDGYALLLSPKEPEALLAALRGQR